ncbi:MAG: hypothetical protein H0W54_03735 [Rubrobacter sp.]|nr:hypothetical protein [Rubrobacter sp.]
MHLERLPDRVDFIPDDARGLPEGAVYRQLAGLHYGETGIPERWREKLALRERIEDYAADLLQGNLKAPT